MEELEQINELIDDYSEVVPIEQKFEDLGINLEKYDFSAVSLIKNLGEGAFGKVYLGEIEGIKVAVKVMDVKQSEVNIKEFQAEVKIMMVVSGHPNIVQLLGVSTGEQYRIITEFCCYGSLHDLLIKEKKQTTLVTLTRLAAEAASGINALHNKNIIHRDIALRNCLVSEGYHVKISDFGTSRMAEWRKDDNYTKSDVGPIRWMAPESLKNKVFGGSSDSYSFGIMLWEMLAREIPYGEMNLVDIFTKVVNEGFRPEIPEGADLIWKSIMLQCWKTNPKDRPSMKIIENILKERYEQLISRSGEPEEILQKYQEIFDKNTDVSGKDSTKISGSRSKQSFSEVSYHKDNSSSASQSSRGTVSSSQLNYAQLPTDESGKTQLMYGKVPEMGQSKPKLAYDEIPEFN